MRHEYEHMWRYGHAHFWGYGHGWWAAMPAMMLGSLLLTALFIALAWMLIHWLTTSILPGKEQQSGLPPNHPSAFELLHQRYARGEIDAITFEEMQEQSETLSWQSQRRRTDLLKDERPISWLE